MSGSGGPGILYLHGMGRRVRHGAWFAALNAALAGHGLPARRRAVDLLVPDYVDLLVAAGAPWSGDPPRSTYDVHRAADARAGFMRERALLAAELGDARPAPRQVPTALYEIGRHTWGVVSREMRSVEHYRRHPHLRHQVLSRVLDEVGEHRDLVVVAHSLGALVALDVLPHLPAGTRVRRLITLGSPAGWPSLHRGPGRSGEAFPYERVGSWVNLHSPRDLVPLGRGASRLFPAAVDVRTPLPAVRHAAELYLGTEVFGRVLAQALGR